MDSKLVGARIQLFRERTDMTQKELAERLGCTPQHISAIERGIKTPKLETFVDICNVLQVQPNLLLRDVIDGWEESWEADLERVLGAVLPNVRRRIKRDIMNAQQAAEELRDSRIRFW